MSGFSRRAGILAAILAALVLAIAATYVRDAARAADSTRTTRFMAADPALAARIKFAEKGAGLVLEKEDGTWYVLDGVRRLPARTARVDAFLATLGARREFRLAARSPESRDRLGLGASARQARVEDGTGKVLADILAGDPDASGASIFASRAGSPESWSTAPDFSSYLGTARRPWLDLRVGGGAVPMDEVRGFAARGSLLLDARAGERFSASYDFRRGDDGAWTLTGDPGAKVDAAALERTVRMALGFEARDWLPADEPAPGTAGLVIEVALADGARRTWTFTERGDGYFDGRGTAASFPFLVDAYGLRAALVPLGDLLAD